MEIQKIQCWKVKDTVFEDEEEAIQYAIQQAKRNAVEILIDSFFYVAMPREDVIQSIAENLDELKKIAELKKEDLKVEE